MRKRTLFFIALAALNAQLMQSVTAEPLPLKFPFLPFGPVNSLIPVGNPAGFRFSPTAGTSFLSASRGPVSPLPVDNSPTPKGLMFLVTNRSIPATAYPNFVQNLVTPNVASNGGAASCQADEGGNCPVASFVTDKLPEAGKFSRSGNMQNQFLVNASIQLGAGTTSGQACAIAHVVFFKDANRMNTRPENRLKYPLGTVCSTREGTGNRSSVSASFDVIGFTLGPGPKALAIEVTCQYGGLTGTAAQQGAAAGMATCEAVQPILDISYLEMAELVHTGPTGPTGPVNNPNGDTRSP